MGEFHFLYFLNILNVPYIFHFVFLNTFVLIGTIMGFMAAAAVDHMGRVLIIVAVMLVDATAMRFARATKIAVPTMWINVASVFHHLHQ